MKFLYYPYDIKCNFLYGQHNRITIEDNVIFEQFIVDLNQSITNSSDLFYLEEDNKEIKLEKFSSLINSPLDLKYNKKDFQKFLYQELAEELQITDDKERIFDYLGKLIQEMDILRARTQYNIEFDEEIDYSSLFKMLNVQLEQPKGNFIEKLLDYISTQVELLNKKIFFIANCASFFNEEWYNHILKWSEYHNVIIVFIENRQSVFDENINEYILDKDMCEIH